MGIKSLVYRVSRRGSRREKTEECKDHRLYHATHRAGTPARDISIAFYLSSFLLLVSLLF